MTKRRDKIKIAADILNVCRTPQGKTKIVYACNLNFHTVEPLLDLLLRRKLGRDSEIGWNFWNSFTACDPVDAPHEDQSWINQYLIMAFPFG
jgi:hypothetical protein